MRRIGFLLLLLTTYYLLPATSLAQSVDLLWQGDTYTPPFYKGLSLWSSQSRITFVAIPHIPNINPSTLIYRWSKDGTVLGASSGIDKRSLSFGDTVLSLPVEVKIDIFKEEGTNPLGSASVFLKPQTPRLLVVENSPLYGLLLNKVVLDEFIIKEDEVTFSALPLFSSVSQRNAPAIAYTWRTNTGDKRSGSTVTYRAPEKGEGASLVTLRATNSQILAQPPEKNILIKFNKQNGL